MATPPRATIAAPTAPGRIMGARSTWRRRRARVHVHAWVLIVFILAGCTDSGDGAADGSVPAGDAGRDSEVPFVPELEPLSALEARELAAYARTLRAASKVDAEQLPVAWAMVNVSCEERTMALQYALAVASERPRPEPPVLDNRELDADAIHTLARRAQQLAASINIVGPLITDQTWILPDGTEVGQGRLRWFWSYHHAVAINVEGTLRVLDLSVGDEPISIAQWARGFVEPSIACVHMSDAEHEAVTRYFLPAFANLIPGERPERACGYNFTPIFTLAPGRDAQVESVLGAADTMQVQHGAMHTLLTELGVTLDAEQLPLVRSHYTPLSEAELCSWNRLNYCDLLERPQP